jgi:hypothetical protein
MRSSAKLGAFCRKDAASPVLVSVTMTGNRKRPVSNPIAATS